MQLLILIWILARLNPHAKDKRRFESLRWAQCCHNLSSAQASVKRATPKSTPPARVMLQCSRSDAGSDSPGSSLVGKLGSCSAKTSKMVMICKPRTQGFKNGFIEECVPNYPRRPCSGPESGCIATLLQGIVILPQCGAT